MPLSYFDMADRDVFRDEDGVHFDDDTTARREAVRALTAYAADIASSGNDRQVFTITVSNARRRAIYSATLALNAHHIRWES